LLVAFALGFGGLITMFVSDFTKLVQNIPPTPIY
jgi:hypothetical protein